MRNALCRRFFFNLFVAGACMSCASRPKDADKARTYFELGISMIQDGRNPESLAAFQKSWELDSTRPETLMHVGIAYLKLEKLPEAEDHLARACHMREPFPECWNNLSYIQTRRGRFNEAVVSANKALAIDTYSTPEAALSNLARAQIELGHFTEGKTALTKALRFHPESCDLRMLLSLLHVREKNFEAALDESRRTVLYCNQEPMAHLWEAYSYYKLGHRAEAERKYRDIIQLFRKPEQVDASRVALERLHKRVPLDEPKS